MRKSASLLAACVVGCVTWGCAGRLSDSVPVAAAPSASGAAAGTVFVETAVVRVPRATLDALGMESVSDANCGADVTFTPGAGGPFRRGGADVPFASLLLVMSDPRSAQTVARLSVVAPVGRDAEVETVTAGPAYGPISIPAAAADSQQRAVLRVKPEAMADGKLKLQYFLQRTTAMPATRPATAEIRTSIVMKSGEALIVGACTVGDAAEFTVVRATAGR